MSVPDETKLERINLRLRQNAWQILSRAASIEGTTISRFILSSAIARARQTIHDHEVMALNARESEAFYDALDQPIRFNDALTAALEEHDRRVVSN